MALGSGSASAGVGGGAARVPSDDATPEGEGAAGVGADVAAPVAAHAAGGPGFDFAPGSRRDQALLTTSGAAPAELADSAVDVTDDGARHPEAPLGQLCMERLPYAVRDMEGRGRGILATRKLAVDEVVMQDTALLCVRTFMILSGVIVYRRSRVERMYEALSAAEQATYMSLCPLCSRPTAGAGGDGVDGEDTGVRQRRATRGESPAPAPPKPADAKGPTPEEHKLIWDRNAFHFNADADVSANRWLHFLFFPATLSVAAGSAWAYVFRGQYLRSIFGAAVLFFGTLGPIGLKFFYLGSQALFSSAALVNHSCLPNAVVSVDAHRGPLGDETASGASVGAAEGPVRLTVRTKRTIPAGEEITIDYIPDLAHLPPLDRRALLLQDYGFTCDCSQCLTAERAGPATQDQEAEEVW